MTDAKKGTKGIQSHIQLSYENFKNALYKNDQNQIKNSVIRLRNHEMVSEEALKVGLRDVYVKADVLSDRITVRPFKKYANISEHT